MPDWSDKVVVVTGASAGLGLAIAEAFHQRGANLVLAARRRDPLLAAKARLGWQQATRDAQVIPCEVDVTVDADVARLVETVVANLGRLDVWVNNAGRSDRGRIADCPIDRMRELLEINFLAAARCTQAALPHLAKSRGSLVNIGSLSAKTASPYLGGYAPSKFALAAYTQQLRLETRSQGIHVLFVCPGPIATSGRHAESVPRDALVPEAALGPGGGVKLPRINPDRIARDIVSGCERRQTELVYPARARILFAIQQAWPTLGDWIVRRMTPGD